MSDIQDNKDKFKDTVFLPKTEFPMRGNLPAAEPEMVQLWKDMDLYAKIRAKSAGKPRWILHDGPPYANGNIHMGHALNKILKDVINKSWQMMGYDAPYVPGWDCHGLPIEWKIEEKYRAEGKDKDEVDPIDFRGECREFAQSWVDIQAEQFQRLGVIGDWKNPYRTMTKPAEAQIAREIHKFALNRGLYKGLKPVMWSTVEKTALAEAEVEYHEHKSITIWVKFPVMNSFNPALEGASIVIWTTTPWTMPSNRAIACGAEIDYGVYQISAVADDSKIIVGDKLVIANKLVDDVKEKAKITDAIKLADFKGSDIAGAICAHPLRGQGYDFDVPVLLADFVEDTAGTGFVHIAPSHGADDFNLVQSYNTLKEHGQSIIQNGWVNETIQPLDFIIQITDFVTDDGKFRETVPLFGGMEIYDKNGKMAEGNFAPIRAIDEAGMLVAKGSLKHEYPHSWRSKAPVIFRATPQWFIAMDVSFRTDRNDSSARTLRERSLQAIKDTNWYPAKGQARITAMIEGRPDWCISRQRAWGVPIALFISKSNGEVLNDEAVFNRIADAFEVDGADAWWSRDPQEFLGSAYKADDYEQIFDIVDVWFESGSTHSFVVDARQDLGNGEDKQVDLYLEGSDQHRGWFHSSLLESCGTKGRAPYKNVLTHGFVLDEKGYKMSKSLGNVVDPLKIMDQTGADILRLWTMTSDYAEDIRIGKDTLKNTSDMYRRLRNTLRFLLGAIDGYTQAEAVALHSKEDVQKLPELEQWMLNRLAEMDSQIRGFIENYDYGKMAKLLYNFCNEDLSSFYFDIRKDRLYCDAPDSFDRRAARTVMATIFDCLVAWLAPVLSFTTEEAWSHRPTGVFEDVDSVHLREFTAVPAIWKNESLTKKWLIISGVRDGVLHTLEQMRTQKKITSSLEAVPHIAFTRKQKEAFSSLTKNEIADIFITSEVIIIDEVLEDETIMGFKADGEKCVRCWKVLPEVTQHAEHLCNRCDHVVHAKQKAA
ncbi:MAG: isoleucine--tRNA ligase [Alphaproteobacteria bacterium]|nr:isoleucine--tRNA ligase [Alphaproteobacteria bacterium]NCQ88808.1 isoleucine--tRNA ligase [Alphaproteobacteria bacterium]NCT07269.1 isoleucine--tRNA ligase [Alphaproteobacteria bacterium]